MIREGKTYVIQTSDGLGNDGVFLSWTNSDGGYYTTVDCIDEISESDFYDSIDRAIERAKDANSGTLFGWDAPMKIMELRNFNEAYNNNQEPELLEILTLTF